MKTFIEFLNEQEEDALPQAAVGKSTRAIAKMLEPKLRAVGIKLLQMEPVTGAIWSVESSKYPDKMITLHFTSAAKGGHGINKDRMLYLGFEIYNKDGTEFEPERMNFVSSAAAQSYSGIAKLYRERVA